MRRAAAAAVRSGRSGGNSRLRGAQPLRETNGERAVIGWVKTTHTRSTNTILSTRIASEPWSAAERRSRHRFWDDGGVYWWRTHCHQPRAVRRRLKGLRSVVYSHGLHATADRWDGFIDSSSVLTAAAVRRATAAARKIALQRSRRLACGNDFLNCRRDYMGRSRLDRKRVGVTDYCTAGGRTSTAVVVYRRHSLSEWSR